MIWWFWLRGWLAFLFGVFVNFAIVVGFDLRGNLVFLVLGFLWMDVAIGVLVVIWVLVFGFVV